MEDSFLPSFEHAEGSERRQEDRGHRSCPSEAPVMKHRRSVVPGKGKHEQECCFSGQMLDLL